MSRVLVTGGAGTIGAAVVKRLLADPDYEGGANTISLNQARENFALHGVSELRFKANVRAPLPEELP